MGAPSGGTQGDCVTIEGLAPPSPADPGGQAEGLERPKAKTKAEKVQTPEEEVNRTENKPEDNSEKESEPKKRHRRIRRKTKRQQIADRRAAREAAKKAKKEAKRKAKEEAKKELPKAEVPEEGLPQEQEKAEIPEAECASGSTARDLQAERDSGNEDSEGEYESLSSTECHDPEPILIEPIFLKPTSKRKAICLKPTSKARAICLKSVERNPIRLQSVRRSSLLHKNHLIVDLHELIGARKLVSQEVQDQKTKGLSLSG